MKSRASRLRRDISTAVKDRGTGQRVFSTSFRDSRFSLVPKNFPIKAYCPTRPAPSSPSKALPSEPRFGMDGGHPPSIAPANQQAATWVAVDYVPPPMATANPYVQVSPIAAKSPMETVLKVLGRCGKKLEDTTRKAGGAAENIWRHLKTGPSLTDAAVTRLSQGTKVLAEGGHDKIFQQTFELLHGEKLRKAYACYLSTSSGPVVGTLYLSTRRLAFCSGKPLCHNIAPGQQEWIYYKVILKLEQVRALNPCANRINPAEKYIQIITVDNHEFWFMGFVSYEKAVKNLTEALQQPGLYHP